VTAIAPGGAATWPRAVRALSPTELLMWAWFVQPGGGQPYGILTRDYSGVELGGAKVKINRIRTLPLRAVGELAEAADVNIHYALPYAFAADPAKAAAINNQPAQAAALVEAVMLQGIPSDVVAAAYDPSGKPDLVPVLLGMLPAVWSLESAANSRPPEIAEGWRLLPRLPEFIPSNLTTCDWTRIFSCLWCEARPSTPTGPSTEPCQIPQARFCRVVVLWLRCSPSRLFACWPTVRRFPMFARTWRTELCGARSTFPAARLLITSTSCRLLGCCAR
jgi:hypothetical protein